MKNKNFSIPNSTRLIVKFAIIIVIIICILDLIGWIFNVTFLKGFNLEWTPMKVITALSFIFSDITILFFQINSQTRLQKFLPKVIAVIISIIGFLTIAAYINVFRTGIDFPFVNFPFFNLFLAPDTRMALVTASLFFIIGVVLFLLSSDKSINANIAHVFILPVLIVSYIVISSYILNVHSLYKIQNVSVALNTGIAFLILSLAVLFIRSDTWLMKVFTSENAGGIMARKLLPILMVLPVIIGWFRIYGELSNLYVSELGVLLVAITYVICFLLLVWFTAKSVNRIDYKNKKRLELVTEEWQTTFDSISDAISIQDKDYRLLRVNKSYEKMVGLTNEELIGKKCFEIIHKTKCPIIGCPHAKTIETGKNTNVEIYEPHFGIYIEESTSSVINKKGEVIGSVHIIKDITMRKKAEIELKKSNRTLKARDRSSHQLIHSKDELEYINEVCKIVIEDCGYTMIWVGYAENDEEKTVKHIASYGFEDGYIENLKIIWSDTEHGRGPTGTAIRTGMPTVCKNMLTDPCFGPWRDEALKRGYASSIVLPLKDNDHTFGAISIYSEESDPFLDEEMNLLSELANDLSYGITILRKNKEREKIQKDLKEANLLAEMATVTANEAQSKAENAMRIAEDAMKSKQQFLANMSHEIRTPMNTIIGFTKVMLKTDLSSSQKEYLTAIKLSGDALIVLINDILDLAKVDAGKLTFEKTPFKMALSISAMLHLFELKIHEKNLELVKDYDNNIPEVLIGDPVRLH